MSQILQNINLAELTAFQVGGQAQQYLRCQSTQEFLDIAPHINWPKNYWCMGSGTNVLISDNGLKGLVIHFSGGTIKYSNGEIIADSGVIWDDLVKFSIKHNLWGIELMSGIPGTVGGAVAININAYGQALSDTLKWVEIYDPGSHQVMRQKFQPSQWSYKQSPFNNRKSIIIRMGLSLSQHLTTPLSYATAQIYAQDHQLDETSLSDRRKIIMATRSQAGSLLDNDKHQAKTCGSFFKNPVVGNKQINQLIAFDETNLQLENIKKMNLIHGGLTNRISAAHVLLAAGFKRGQTFGPVRLHPDHVLKLENYKLANADQLYQVAKSIQKTVKIKLDIDLEFEVKTLGQFNEVKNNASSRQ